MQKLKGKIEIVAILLVLIGVGLSYLFLNSVEHYKIKNDSVYFVNGIDYDLPKGSSVLINDDGTLTFKVEDFEVVSSSLPIYEKEDYKIILSTEMAYYEPSFNGKFNVSKVPQLTEVLYEPSTLSAILSRDGDKKAQQNGFLFDGHNTYIFLEKFNIEYNNKTIELSPLSYGIVENETWVQFYDCTTGEYYYDEISDKVYALSKINNYTISLGSDVVTAYEKSTIMSSGFVMLKDYFEGSEE